MPIVPPVQLPSTSHQMPIPKRQAKVARSTTMPTQDVITSEPKSFCSTVSDCISSLIDAIRSCFSHITLFFCGNPEDPDVLPPSTVEESTVEEPITSDADQPLTPNVEELTPSDIAQLQEVVTLSQIVCGGVLVEVNDDVLSTNLNEALQRTAPIIRPVILRLLQQARDARVQIKHFTKSLGPDDQRATRYLFDELIAILTTRLTPSIPATLRRQILLQVLLPVLTCMHPPPLDPLPDAESFPEETFIRPYPGLNNRFRQLREWTQRELNPLSESQVLNSCLDPVHPTNKNEQEQS